MLNHMQFFLASAGENTSIINTEMRHLFFPKIITYTLITLFVLLMITNRKKIISTLVNIKEHGKSLDIVTNKKIFFGNLILLFGYVILLDLIGFAIATLTYVFLTILLFYKKATKKTLILAGTVSVSVTVFVVVLFGIIFRITLP